MMQRVEVALIIDPGQEVDNDQTSRPGVRSQACWFVSHVRTPVEREIYKLLDSKVYDPGKKTRIEPRSEQYNRFCNIFTIDLAIDGINFKYE